MRDKLVVWVALAALLVGPGVSRAAAQGGTTGSITGTVTDNTGAVLPGVTVTSTSPAQMGAKVGVTNEQGIYRFPNVVPGIYTLTFDLGGFNKVIREDIEINIGFTATVNTTLTLASVQENVVVTGESPVIDIKNTNVQNNFTEAMLKSMPNARDIWAVLGAAPGMRVNTMDVGGNTAGTQKGFTAFGAGGQIRAQLEGVNTTEGTGAAGFYYNYGAFQELQISVDSNDASAATPGVQLNAVMKSGGNQFKGDFYYDYENQKMQGRNVTPELERVGIGAGQRILQYRDPNIGLGGPIMKDKLWYFVSLREQKTGVTVSGYPAEQPSDFKFATILTNGTEKVTYQLSQNNKLSHFAEVGRKQQPHRGADANPPPYSDAVFFQDSTSYAGNLEWSNILSSTFHQSASIAAFGYNWPDLPYGPTLELQQNVGFRRSEENNRVAGGATTRRNNRRRLQFDWKGNWYRDNLWGADHNIRMGYTGEREAQIFTGIGFRDSIQLNFNSPGLADFSTPYRVVLFNAPYKFEDRINHQGAYFQDQISLNNRLTVNAGLRWDYYNANYPEQEILDAPFRSYFYAGTPLPNGHSLPATPYAGDFTVPARDAIIKNKAAIAPRFGVSYDLSGNGKSVIKVNWGRYFNNPGTQGGQNPVGNTSVTFGWNDLDGNKLFTLNELGPFSSGGSSAFNTVDPGIGHPYSNDFSVTYERELGRGTSLRSSYVFKGSENGYVDVEMARLGSLYTNQLTRTDPGVDGIAGTSDDGPSFIAFDIPAGVTIPASRTDRQTRPENRSSADNINVTFNKRMSNRWSLVADVLHTWTHEECFLQNPNNERTCVQDLKEWTFKMFGTYQAPWDIIVSPLLRHGSGANLQRSVRVSGGGLRIAAFNYAAELPGAYRGENNTVFDMRVEKRLKLNAHRALSLFFDAFNIANANYVQSRETLSGTIEVTLPDGSKSRVQQFLRPTAILPPRVFRLGLRLEF